jgi:hypothetical protein
MVPMKKLKTSQTSGGENDDNELEASLVVSSSDLDEEKPAKVDPADSQGKIVLSESMSSSSSSDFSLDEHGIIKEEDILGINRKCHTIICVFVLMTMSFINLFINRFIYRDINPLKVLLAVTPLIYFNVLFLNIVKILKQFRYRDILKNTMIYFNRRFA